MLRAPLIEGVTRPGLIPISFDRPLGACSGQKTRQAEQSRLPMPVLPSIRKPAPKNSRRLVPLHPARLGCRNVPSLGPFPDPKTSRWRIRQRVHRLASRRLPRLPLPMPSRTSKQGVPNTRNADQGASRRARRWNGLLPASWNARRPKPQRLSRNQRPNQNLPRRPLLRKRNPSKKLPSKS